MPLAGAASDALDNREVWPAWFGFLDFRGDPVRATTWRAPVAFTGTGDGDLDGNTFPAINHEIIEVSDISQGDTGSDTLEVALSGLITIDSYLMTTIGKRANWAGRVARLWLGVYDGTGNEIGAVSPFYTGYMTSVEITGSAGEQRIVVSVENYLAAFSQASNRSYLDQEYYDPGDLSARAAIDIANGVTGNPLTGNTPVYSGHDRWRNTDFDIAYLARML